MVSTQVRQSEGSVFKPRSGQIAYLHGVSQHYGLVIFLVVRTQRKRVGPVSDNILETSTNDWRGWYRHYQCISGIRLGLQ